MSDQKAETSWTQDQQKAIEHKGKGIVVSAAAGSGKTAVLIERIIRQLTEGKKVPADKLLAVTFTKAAAAQLRDKLNRAFEKKIRENPSDKELINQQNLLQLAKISTIDSFCLELVKENLHQFDFQGGLKILDDADRQLIFENAFSEASDQMCGEFPEKYYALINAFGSDDKLFSLCRSFSEFLGSLAFREDWISKAREMYNQEHRETLINECFEKCEKITAGVEPVLDKLRCEINKNVEAGGENFAAADYIGGVLPKEEKGKITLGGIDIINDQAGMIRKFCREKKWDELCNLALNKSRMISTTIKNKKNLPEDILNGIDDIKKECAALKKQASEILTEALSVFPVTLKNVKNTFERAQMLFDYLLELTENTEKIAQEYKLEKNAVEFNDVMIMAKDLLVTKNENGEIVRTPLGESISKGDFYRIILIDEFQDVNNLQEIIFKAISCSDSLETLGNNVFVVGDMKQAIYGFRLTNPELFQNNLKQADDEKYSHKLESVYLKKNFRSRKEVIDFTNFVFGLLMSEKCGGVEYTDKERLEQGAEYTPRKVPVEAMIIKNSQDFPSDSEYTLENYTVAKKIREMLDEKYPVCEKGIDRPCRPSDFCILVMKNDETRNFAKALEKFGLNAASEDKSGYLQSREITVALNILRVIDNPLNDMALTAVMMSPVLGFTADEMSRIALKCREKNQRYPKKLFQLLVGTDSSKIDAHEKNADYIDMEDEILQKKCENTYRLFSQLRYCAMCMTVEELIRTIYEKTDLMGIVSMYRDTDKKRANLRLLLEYASDFGDVGGEGISGFLRYVDSLYEKNEAFKNASTIKETENCVDIKTFHSSKGLEYPFVFLCQLDSPLVKTNSFYFHNEYGFGFEFDDREKYVQKYNPVFNFIKDKKEQEDKSERMRLFYVGCTRAREKLFLSCFFGKSGNKGLDTKARECAYGAKIACEREKISCEDVLSMETMLQWVVMALSRIKGNDALFEWLGIPKFNKYCGTETNVEIEFNTYKYNCEEQTEETVITEEKADSQLADRLFERFLNAEKSVKESPPNKLTVTEIVKEEMEKEYGDKNPEFYPNLPRLDDELDKLTNAEKGTFTHKFMELADYSNAEKSVDNELHRLVSQGFFTPKEARGVYKDALKKFFEGDFYSRMKNSSDVRREQRFLACGGDLNLPETIKSRIGDEGMIQGIADCIFKESDGWVLVDYKTDNFHSTDEMEKYSTQLAIYKAAFEKILNEKIKRSYIYSFKLGVGREFIL